MGRGRDSTCRWPERGDSSGLLLESHRGSSVYRDYSKGESDFFLSKVGGRRCFGLDSKKARRSFRWQKSDLLTKKNGASPGHAGREGLFSDEECSPPPSTD